MKATDRTFETGGLVFRCYVRDDGSYTWRTQDGAYAAQREGHHYKARAGAERIGDRYSTLSAAMGACVAASVSAQIRERRRRAG